MADRPADQHTRPDRGTNPRSGPETVVVHGSDVSVRRANVELPLAEARSRFGGVDVPALLGGALAGLGTAALLGALATAVGLEVVQGDAETLAVGALVTALVLLALSALVAGWVAGRSARFDGARNGLLAGVALALLVLALGAAHAATADGSSASRSPTATWATPCPARRSPRRSTRSCSARSVRSCRRRPCRSSGSASTRTSSPRSAR